MQGKNGRVATRRVVAKDVAQRVGVSVSTVSMVMRDDTRVSENTRALVRSVAKEMNYRPQAAGRAMRGGWTHTIGVLLAYQPFLDHENHGRGLIEAFAEALQGIGESLLRRNYHMSFVPLMPVDLESGEVSMPRMFIESSVDGVLVVQPPFGEMRQVLEDLGARYVVLDGPPQQGIFSVSVDEVRAAEMAVEHLIELGHRQIAYVAGSTTSSMEPMADSVKKVHRQDQFVTGYTVAMAKSGLSAMYGWEPSMSFVERLESLWIRGEKPTALITYDVRAAQEANMWLIQKGLSVPRDVSLVSLHHTGGAAERNLPLMPALTCKSNQQANMAEIAVEKLLYIIKNPDEPVANPVVLEPQFMFRESSGSCR